MRDSVEDLLWAELGRRLEPTFLERLPVIGRRATRRRRKRDEGPTLISALESIEVLGSAEAASWQGRLAQALTDRETKSDAWTPDARGRAAAHLRALSSDPDDGARGAAVEAYESTGLLSSEAVEEWAEEGGLFEGGEEGDATSSDEELGHLRAVVLGPPDVTRGLRLVAAELYSGYVVIRWHRLRTAPRDDRLCVDRAQPVMLRDELGTRYELLNGAAGQSGQAIAGSWWFSPGAPKRCRRLELEFFGARLSIDPHPQ